MKLSEMGMAVDLLLVGGVPGSVPGDHHDAATSAPGPSAWLTFGHIGPS